MFKTAMIVGSVVTIGSAIAYVAGKVFIEQKADDFSKAISINERIDERDGEGGCVGESDKSINLMIPNKSFVRLRGELRTSVPIEVQADGKQLIFIKTKDEMYHVLETPVSKSQTSTCNEYVKRMKLIETRYKLSGDVNINGVNVSSFVMTLPHKFVCERFEPLNFVPSSTSNVLDDDCTQVIGYQHKTYGVKAGKTFTVFGEYDANNNRVKLSSKYPCMITTSTGEEVIKSWSTMSKVWKFVSVTGILAGLSVCGVTYFTRSG